MRIFEVHRALQVSRAWDLPRRALLTTVVLMLTLDSLLHLAQATRASLIFTLYWELLKWILVSVLLTLTVIGRDSSKARYSIAPGESTRSATIDRIYVELRQMMVRVKSEPELQLKIDQRLAELRKLQEEEAEEMERRFNAGLLLKPGEGLQVLQRAEALLAKYENSASENAPASQQS